MGEPMIQMDGGNSFDFDFNALVRLLRLHGPLVRTVTLACLAAALLYAAFCPPTYEAVTTVKVPDFNNRFEGKSAHDLTRLSTGDDPMDTYLEVARSAAVAQRAAQALSGGGYREWEGAEDRPGYLLKHTDADFSRQSNILSIRARARTPQDAAALANAWVQSYIQTYLQLTKGSAQARYEFIHKQLTDFKKNLEDDEQRPQNYLNPSKEEKANEIDYAWLLEEDHEARIEADLDDTGIVPVDKAVPPREPVKPKRAEVLALGLVLGLLLGLQAAFFAEKAQDYVRREEDLLRLTGTAPMASIPDFQGGGNRPHPSPAGGPPGDRRLKLFGYRESFKILRTHLTFSPGKREMKAIAVLSPCAQEGKSLVNADLALALAETGRNVLLVDADLRNPSLHKLFGLPWSKTAGWTRFLECKNGFPAMAVPSGFPNLSLLPVSVCPPNPAELLESEGFARFIQEMKSHYDYLVFDAPPLLPVADSVLLAARLDGVLLMARLGQTRRAEVRKALQLLRSVDVAPVGTILNGVELKEKKYLYAQGPAPQGQRALKPAFFSWFW